MSNDNACHFYDNVSGVKQFANQAMDMNFGAQLKIVI